MSILRNKFKRPFGDDIIPTHRGWVRRKKGKKDELVVRDPKLIKKLRRMGLYVSALPKPKPKPKPKPEPATKPEPASTAPTAVEEEKRQPEPKPEPAANEEKVSASPKTKRPRTTKTNKTKKSV